jgi:hypothetical protein
MWSLKAKDPCSTQAPSFTIIYMLIAVPSRFTQLLSPGTSVWLSLKYFIITLSKTMHLNPYSPFCPPTSHLVHSKWTSNHLVVPAVSLATPDAGLTLLHFWLITMTSHPILSNLFCLCLCAPVQPCACLACARLWTPPWDSFVHSVSFLSFFIWLTKCAYKTLNWIKAVTPHSSCLRILRWPLLHVENQIKPNQNKNAVFLKLSARAGLAPSLTSSGCLYPLLLWLMKALEACLRVSTDAVPSV